MTDPAVLAGYRARLWAAVNELTQPSRVALPRDDGTTTYAVVPSLWDQACDALTGGMESSVRVSNPFERSPVDLTLVAARHVITVQTRAALTCRHVTPAHTVPAQIRQLAVIVTTSEPDHIWAHADVLAGWARGLTAHLASVRTVTAVRIRDSACPECGARTTVVDTVDGPVVASALVVDFHDGYVRAATCGECGESWFRGVELEQLALLLGCPAVA